MMTQLRKATPFEEFDYQALLDALKAYKKPRDKITHLLAQNEIIRVKKGLYVFGEQWRKSPLSLEVLANLIYGPSYVSLHYALAFYGMIPERVYTVTSVTSGKKKQFETPVGRFTYYHLVHRRYAIGYNLLELNPHRFCLIATPEKALADTIFFGPQIEGREEMQKHLYENLRIDPTEIKKLHKKSMRQIAKAYHSRNVSLLAECL